jgi:hypothetical protein
VNSNWYGRTTAYLAKGSLVAAFRFLVTLLDHRQVYDVDGFLSLQEIVVEWCYSDIHQIPALTNADAGVQMIGLITELDFRRWNGLLTILDGVDIPTGHLISNRPSIEGNITHDSA